MSKAVEIQNFSYQYSDGTPALQDINISIDHGQRVALIGSNGAGKSTLLLAMAGFIRGNGKVLIDGMLLNHRNLKKIRTIIGSCLENPDDQLFMPNLFDDIGFGPMNMGFDGDEVKRRVEESLNTVGLSGMGHKAGHHLSAGQKRAAAIATILSMSPSVITFDEPDGSLDPRNRKNITNLLKNLKQTLIIATCNMNFAAELADRAILLDNGCIVADGEPEKIMYDPKLMEEHGLEVPQF